MKKIVLHVGPHKTGSTYIQRNLFEQAPLLRERNVFYPINGWIFHYGHHNLVDESLIGTVRGELSGVSDSPDSTIVLSSENLDRLDIEAIQSLRDQLEADDVLIVFYVRSVEALLYSAWQEEVKFGSDASFLRFLLSHLARPFMSEFVNPAVILDRWASVFGEKSLVIFDYDGLREQELDIFETFLSEVLLIVDVPPAITHFENKSLGPVEAELLRALNAMDRSLGNEPREILRGAFMANQVNPVFQEMLTEARQLIEKSLRPLALRDLRLVEFARTELRAKYRNIRYATRENFDLSLQVPDDTWMLSAGAYTACLRPHTYLRTWLSMQ